LPVVVVKTYGHEVQRLDEVQQPYRLGKEVDPTVRQWACQQQEAEAKERRVQRACNAQGS